MNAQDAITSLVISTAITLCIANSIHLIKKTSVFLKASEIKKHFLIWTVVIIGLFLGYEIALFSLSLIFGLVYVPFSHIVSFLPWAGLSLLIGGLIYTCKLFLKS